MIAPALFWMLFLVAAIAPLRWTVYFFFAALSFGSLTVVPGSVTILPTVPLSILLVAKVLFAGQRTTLIVDAALNVAKFGWLTAFMIVAAMVTVTAPFIFSGAPVMGLNTLRLTPLSFGSGNLTQLSYLTVSYLLTICLYLLIVTDEHRQTVAKGLLIGGSMALASGVLDLVTAGSSALDHLRTATYVIMDNAVVGGTRRVIGFTTEASAYGGLTLSFAAILIFIRPSRFLGRSMAILEILLAAGLLVFCYLSTSSSAYLGLAVLALLLLVRMAVLSTFAASAGERRAAAIGFASFFAGIITVATVLLLQPAIGSDLAEQLDVVLLQKPGSESYNERGNWNRVSMDGFFATGGYGVGVGSTRASSWPVAVLSSTGVPGATVFVIFLCMLLLSRVDRRDEAQRAAGIGARLAFLITIAPAAVAGTAVDFGAINGILFAFMAAAHSGLVIKPIGGVRWSRLEMRSRHPLGGEFKHLNRLGLPVQKHAETSLRSDPPAKRARPGRHRSIAHDGSQHPAEPWPTRHPAPEAD